MRNNAQALEKPRFRRAGTSGSLVEIRLDGQKRNTHAFVDNPEELYREWQTSPFPISIGHWEYMGWHELISANMLAYVKQSFDEMGDAACFMSACVLLALIGTGKSSDVPRHVFELSCSFINDRVVRDNVVAMAMRIRKRYRIPVAALVVYPIHPVTSLIASRIQELMPNDLAKRIVGVATTHPENGARCDIAPIVRRYVQKTMSEHYGKHVLYFDDATVSFRTATHVTHILRMLGAKSVQYLALLDRRCMGGHDDKCEDYICYWEVDLPRLVARQGCPLCKATDRVRKFQSSLLDGLCLKETQVWLENAAPRSSVTDWPAQRPVWMDLMANNRQRADLIGVPAYITNGTGLALYWVQKQMRAPSDAEYLAFLEANRQALTCDSIVLSTVPQVLMFSSLCRMDVLARTMELLFERMATDDATSCLINSLGAVCFFSLEQNVRRLVAERILHSRVMGRPLSDVCSTIVAYLISEHPDLAEKCDGSQITRSSRALKPPNYISQKRDVLHERVFDRQGLAHPVPLPDFTKRDHRTLRMPEDRSTFLELLQDVRLAQWAVGGLDVYELAPENRDVNPSDLVNKCMSELQSLAECLEQILLVDKTELDGREARVVWEHAGYAREALSALHKGVTRELDISKYRLGQYSAFLKQLRALCASVVNEPLESIRSNKHPSGRPFSNGLAVIHVDSEELDFKGGEKEPLILWVLWDTNIERIVADLLRNVIHRNSPRPIIADGFGRDVDMHVAVKVLVDRVELVLRTLVGPETFSPKSWRWKHLEELGGAVSMVKESNERSIEHVTRIILPCAGYAVQLLEERNVARKGR